MAINDCDVKQIKMLDKHELYYCESPVCNDDCPIANGTAECLKGDQLNINSVNLNKCVCVPGWKGYLCQTKDYTEYENFHFINLYSIPVMIFIVALMIFIC
ncbi:hypothetical protein BCR32DRAFT_272602, partial [Anaeromyces robustus]